MPKVNTAAIPRELTAYPQWVVWRRDIREGKPTKVPYSPKTGRRAAVDNPATWATFSAAVAAMDQDAFDGVGFVLTADDPFVGVDLDHCLDETGRLDPAAAYHVEGLQSYTEITPSGRGLRIFIKGKLPPGRRRLGSIEVYDQGRFLTLTGQRLAGAPATIADRTAVLDFWHADTFGATADPLPQLQPVPVGLDESAILAKACNARNAGPDFEALYYRGDVGLYGGDDSRADYHLCRHLLFWTGGDVSAADRLFRSSALIRPKWDEQRGATTYGERTMAAAFANLRAVYTPNTPPSANGNGHHLTIVERTPVAGQVPTPPAIPGLPAGAPAGPRPCTDLGNAERLIDRHGADLRYCKPWGKWLVWDGRRWKLDDTGDVARRAQQTVRTIYAEAAAIVGDDDSAKALRSTLASWAMKSENRSRIDNMIYLAAPKLPITPDEMDQDPWLLTCENGTLDLRTGQIRPHNRDDLITRLAPVEYDPAATCPILDGVLARIFDNHRALIDFVKKAAGYSMTGDTSERCLFILHGTGANGKSTLVETIAAALGDYSLTTPAETLMMRRDGSVSNDVARLRGARFVSASESEQDRPLAESLVKRLTGGTDQVSARFLYGELFDFKPVGKFWLSTNHKPNIRGVDDAIWSRIRLIPFNVTIPLAEQDKKLAAKLKAELPGIFAWLVAGCLGWQREGLDAPAEVIEASAAYRAEQDKFSGWLDECCEMDPNAFTTARVAFESYRDYTNDTRTSQKAFGILLGKREGLTQGRQGNVRGWIGLKVLDADTQTRLLQE